jgi:hypothetical protein
MPAPARKPGPASVITRILLVQYVLQHRDAAGFSSRPSSRVHDAGLSPCARNTIREAISRDTSSSQHAGHAVRRNRTRSAAGTFSGQLTASAVGGSATRSVVADSLRRRAAPLRRAIARAPRLVLASLGPRRHPRGKSVKVPPIISKSGLWPDGARYDAFKGWGWRGEAI